MTKKKNIASKLVLVLFVLTLISCCLLGSTFARYVSSGSGQASVGIAKWDVDFEDGNGNAAAGGDALRERACGSGRDPSSADLNDRRHHCNLGNSQHAGLWRRGRNDAGRRSCKRRRSSGVHDPDASDASHLLPVCDQNRTAVCGK